MSSFASFAWLAVAFAFFLPPAVVAGIEMTTAVRARRRSPGRFPPGTSEWFEVLVPIYGAIRYLENVSYLAEYGSRVLLCTTAAETPEFYAELAAIADAHGFRIFRSPARSSQGSAKRATGGTTRDRVVRDALRVVKAPYVVCIDADTTTERPLDDVVAAMVERDFDVVSVRLVPSNVDTWLGQLQAHEYRMVMTLRRIAPWLVSGACHAARTAALRDVMDRHSLFFQGNDVETGIVARALGYTVGHLPFSVPTTVPSSLRPWFRQRLAWSGGEVRLFLANFRLIRRHPILWSYGSVVVILGAPLRWVWIATTPYLLPVVLCVYFVPLMYLHWPHRNRWLLAMPLYTAFLSLIMTPLGIYSYLAMAIRSRNAGIILRHRRRNGRTAAARQLTVPPLAAPTSLRVSATHSVSRGARHRESAMSKSS